MNDFWKFASEIYSEAGLYDSSRRSMIMVKLYRYKKDRGIMTKSSKDTVLVWSNEHNAFWKANWNGYTSNKDEAGRYSRQEAEKIVKQAEPGFEEVYELE